MGFFSQDCEECGESIISPYDIPQGLEWQNEAVCITPRGSVICGPYDGYGRVDDHEYAIEATNTVYHRFCWERAGKPTEYLGASRGSDDQGFFYERVTSKIPGPVRI